jgi:formate dehydrogenase major subunit
MDHNRCILCRRCIRACQELIGNYTLGLGGRGANSLIVADMDVPFGVSSCISCGTCLQVCPTGALMDRFSAYRGRDQEVDRTSSTCAACSVGCGVELVARDNQLLRVEGDWDAEVNNGILCVAGRFDPLLDNRRRLFAPMVRENGELRPATWEQAIAAAAKKLSAADAAELSALATPRATTESLTQFAELFKGMGAGNVGSTQAVPEFLAEAEGSMSMLDEADLYLVVGADLDADHQVAGISIRRGVMNRGATLAMVDPRESALTEMARVKVSADDMGDAIALAQGADTPVVVYGAGAGAALAELKAALSGKAQFMGLIPGTNSRGALSLGLNGGSISDGVGKNVYLMIGDDSADGALLAALDEADCVIVQGCYRDEVAEKADVLLPTTIWAEKSGTLVNTEGRSLAMQAALKPPMSVMDDGAILSALAEKL